MVDCSYFNAEEYHRELRKLRIVRVKGGFTLNIFLSYIKTHKQFVLTRKAECRKLIKRMMNKGPVVNL